MSSESSNDSFSKMQIQRYRMMFTIIDQDGDDLISEADLRGAFKDIGGAVGENTIADEMLDGAKDGKMDFNGFLQLVQGRFGGFSDEGELKDAFATFDDRGAIDSNVLRENLLQLAETEEEKRAVGDVVDEFTRENKITGFKKFDSATFIDHVKQ